MTEKRIYMLKARDITNTNAITKQNAVDALWRLFIENISGALMLDEKTIFLGLLLKMT
jgi:hypothetical protein